MARFIVTRSAAGERFYLQSDSGRRLAVSGDYANLDACKKGIRSLMLYLPDAPVVDVTAGEQAPNPKCEVLRADGGYAYRIKARNGKVLLASAPMQTKTAVLRAISMLKEGVVGAEVVFLNPTGYTPLTVRLDAADNAPRASRKKPLSVYIPQEEQSRVVADTEVLADEAELTGADVEVTPATAEETRPDAVTEPLAPAKTPTAAQIVAPEVASARKAPPAPAPAEAPKQGGIFGRIRKVR